MNTSPSRLLAAAAVAALLAACGGGSDDHDDGSSTTPPPEVPPVTTTLSGVVLDGPLQGAKVCVDVNDNRACDAGEPTATTDASGAYSIAEVVAADAAAHPLLVEASATTTIDADDGPVAASFLLAAPAGRGAVISPYTTLLVSEIDGGRAPNVVQAEENVLVNLVGIAGDVGGLTLSSNYMPDDTDATALAGKRATMRGLAQLLTRGFAETGKLGLSGKSATAALGAAATGSLQIVASRVTGPLAAADRETLFAAFKEALVPSADYLAGVATAAAKTGAAPIEGAWLRTSVTDGVTTQELFLFGGDGTFVHQTIDPGVPSTTSTVFDNGFGYRYGRYVLAADGTLTTRLIEASEAAGPADGSLAGVTISGNQLTAAGGLVLQRVTSASDPLVGGWVRTDGSAKPEYLVMFADGSYVHGGFYYQNDPQTGTASFFQTAKSAGLSKGRYAIDAGNASVINFSDTSVAFDGTLAIPSDPGVAHIQADGSLSMTGLRVVKLGTADGAKAVTGFSEATRARLWSGRYFSRTVSVGGTNRTQYVYVRGPDDVMTFLQAPTGSDVTLACPAAPSVDFSSVSPADGKLKQFIVGTSTNASAGYAQRRLHVGLPGAGNYVTYTPIARPSNATARCAVPL